MSPPISSKTITLLSSVFSSLSSRMLVLKEAPQAEADLVIDNRLTTDRSSDNWLTIYTSPLLLGQEPGLDHLSS